MTYVRSSSESFGGVFINVRLQFLCGTDFFITVTSFFELVSSVICYHVEELAQSVLLVKEFDDDSERK